jgi:hypothetical protein
VGYTIWGGRDVGEQKEKGVCRLQDGFRQYLRLQEIYRYIHYISIFGEAAREISHFNHCNTWRIDINQSLVWTL